MRDRVRDERVSSPSTVLDGVGVRCDGEVPCNRNLWVGDTVPAVWPGYDNSSTFNQVQRMSRRLSSAAIMR